MGNPISDAAMQAIAGLVAIGFENARQQIEFGRVEVARQNERLRSVLLDALAHDFLTPLTAIKSAITTVRTEFGHGSEEDEILAVVEEEADRLGELTNEATDMARIETGRLRIQKRAVRILELIEASLKRTKSVMEGRRISVEIQEGIPNAECDPEMLGLAVRQLLGNAAKYSPQETDIGIRAFASDGVITVQILDYGPGIHSEESSLIFERFYRGRHAGRSVTGTGMGLPIARDIIRAHEGELWVENVPGAGARFSFTLPAEK
jgi:two-component system sensor histidine kinase KdpD